MLNYLRLFDYAHTFCSSFVSPDLSPHETVFEFNVSSAREILVASQALAKRVHGEVLSQVRQTYKILDMQLSRLDLRYVVVGHYSGKKLKDMTNKIIDVLKTEAVGFITEDNIVQFDRLDQNALEVLKVGLTKRKIAHAVDPQKILDVLYCIRYRSSDKAIKHRLTKTSLLHPRLLSEMSQGKISVKLARQLMAPFSTARRT